MIVQFWLGAILLLIIASVVFVIPFLATAKRKQNSTDKRNELNRALYDVRINELKSDEDQGLLVDKDKIITELQHNLLDDINDQKLVATDNKNKRLWLPGLALLIFGSIAFYWNVGAYQELTKWEDTLQRYPALQNKLFNERDSRPTEQELRDIMLGLRTQLSKEPNDADGWLLYSRLGMVFKDAGLSLDAIKKAYQLNPNSVDVRLVYAQLKMQKGDEYSQQQAELMLERLLIDEPSELQAWSMYAFMALERQDFSAAILRWKKMLTLIEADSEQAKMLHSSINYAKKQIQESQVALSEPVKVESQTAHVDEAGAPIYGVNISVADNVIVPESGFIIVYAQAVSGPKMPIAAVKLSLTTLPITTQLSDANVMMQGMKLSDHSKFIIKVRLSKSGNAMKKEGDWQGTSQVIKMGKINVVDIIINEQL